MTKRCQLDAWVQLNKKILSMNLMKVCETAYTKVKKDHLLEWKIILWRIQVCKINSDGRPQQEIKEPRKLTQILNHCVVGTYAYIILCFNNNELDETMYEYHKESLSGYTYIYNGVNEVCSQIINTLNLQLPFWEGLYEQTLLPYALFNLPWLIFFITLAYEIILQKFIEVIPQKKKVIRQFF